MVASRQGAARGRHGSDGGCSHAAGACSPGDAAAAAGRCWKRFKASELIDVRVQERFCIKKKSVAVHAVKASCSQQCVKGL